MCTWVSPETGRELPSASRATVATPVTSSLTKPVNGNRSPRATNVAFSLSRWRLGAWSVVCRTKQPSLTTRPELPGGLGQAQGRARVTPSRGGCFILSCPLDPSETVCRSWVSPEPAGTGGHSLSAAFPVLSRFLCGISLPRDQLPILCSCCPEI